MVIQEESAPVSLLPVWGYIPAYQDNALKRLAGAIIWQAAADARSNDDTGQEARAWLLSQTCGDYCAFIGLDFRAVCDWVDLGCTDWRKSHKLP